MDEARSNRTAIVIGAGIVGVSCALQLQRRGVQVTLLDREEPGTQCSFGNAGRIATALCAPYSLPGLLWRVPGMLADSRHPLAMTPMHLLKSLPWFIRYLREGNLQRVEQIADALHAILSRADAALDDLSDNPQTQALIQSGGNLAVYSDHARFRGADEANRFPRERGIVIEELSGDEAREIEPNLPSSVRHAYYYADERFVLNPLRFTQRLVEEFVRADGTLMREEARGIESHTRGAPSVMTSSGRQSADTLVIAAGAWSDRLANNIGVSLPMQAERGYHVMLPGESGRLRQPVHFGDRMIGFTPMEEGMRAITGAEFASPDAPANWKRVDPILAATREFFPGIDTSEAKPWMGARPALPDSLPAIGPSARSRDVVFACGHGHLGLTLSAVTGELVADLATGRQPAIDVEPYSPDRFGIE